MLFLLSVPAQLKSMLLNTAKLLLYTPPNEHFGIVPLEAMLAGVPVLAANNGGPLETVIDGQTGWLRSVTATEEWTQIIRKVLFEMKEEQLLQMGEAGRQRVKGEFSRNKMSIGLDEEINDMIAAPSQYRIGISAFYALMGIIMFISAVIMVPALKHLKRWKDTGDAIQE